jgi:uncharacterized coiled-coil DUF342 family protein
MSSTVVAALVGVLGALVSHYLAAQLKVRAQRERGSSEVQIRQIDAAQEIREELREEIALLKAERSEAFASLDALRREVVALRTALGEAEVFMQRLGEEIEEHLADHPGSAEMNRLYVESLARVRKGLGVS